MSRDDVMSVSFSPCGGRIASASADRTIKVWEASTGTCQSTLSGHDGFVWSVCFSPDGKKIASGARDKTVRIWDAATGAPVGSPLRGHSEDNPECKCFREEEEEDSDDEKPFPRPECPVTGHSGLGS